MIMEGEKEDILSLGFLAQVVDAVSQNHLCAISREALLRELRKHLQQNGQDLLHRNQHGQQRHDGE